jgi:hypothetical protein
LDKKPNSSPSDAAALEDPKPNSIEQLWRKQSSLIFWGCLVFVALAVFPLAFKKIYGSDIWWHIKTGQIILETMEVPKGDLFSFSAPGARWITHEWLFEVVAALIDNVAGFDGLIVMRLVLILATVLLLFILVARKSGSPIFAAFFCYLITFVLHTRFEVRPHLFSFLFLVIESWILLEVLQGRKKLLWWLFPLFFVWANLHAAVDFGLILLACYWLAEAIRFALPGSREKARQRGVLLPLAACGVVSFLLCLINPNGLDALLYPLTLLRLDPIIYANIIEYQSFLAMPLHAYQLFIGITLLGYLVGIKKIRAEHLIIAPFFLVLGLKSVRNVPVFALVTAPLTAELYAGALASLGSSILRRRWLVFAGLGASVLAIYFAGSVYLAVEQQGRFGFGVDRQFLPLDGMEFLHREQAEGNIFNVHRHGGVISYYFYPRLKVFIDGRNEVYADQVFMLYLALMRHEQPGQVLKAMGVDWITVIPVADGLRMARKVFEDPDWNLVYIDDAILIFSLHGVLPAEKEKKLAYRLYYPDYNYVRRLVEQPEKRPELNLELQRAREERENASALFYSSLYYDAVTRSVDAENALVRAYRKNNQIEFINLYFAARFLKSGMIDKAEMFTDRELKINRGSSEALGIKNRIDAQK